MLSQLNACEYPGVLLVLLMCLYSLACWSPNMPDANSFGNSPFIDAKTVEEFRHLFDVLLCFEAWYWLDAVLKDDVNSGRVAVLLGLPLRKW